MAQETQERLASAHHPSLRPQENGGRRTDGPLRSVAAFYALQFHLLRRWSGGWPAVLRRGAETIAVAALSLVATARLVPGISIRDLPTAILLGVVLVAMTTLARPLLIGMLSGFSVALVALATVTLQALLFWSFARSGYGIAVPTVSDAAIASFGYSLASALLTASLSLGDDASFFGTLVRQLAVRQRDATRTDRPGLVVIQIDGVARDVLEEQLRAGGVPTLAGWLRDGMRLDPWETLLPSQTSASQAGILHGNSDGIPGFRWWDKTASRVLISNHPEDAREIERRVSDGHGLLAGGGASIGNLLSGDATRSYLTAATITGPGRELRQSHVLDWFFISPYAYVRWIVLAVGEVLKEIVQSRREAIAGIEPRGDRTLPYPLARAATNVILRHLSTALVIEEMYRGTPTIYVDFVDYDEIAHHSGPRRVEAHQALGGIDRILAWGRVTSLVSEASVIGRFIGPLTHAPFRRMAGLAIEGDRPPDIVVAGSGNLANVSFPHLPGRVTLEEIARRYPRLVEGLVHQAEIGLVMVRTETRGTLVLGASGTNHLSARHIEGVDPVARFGEHAIEGLRRLDAMPDCGDVVIISAFDPARGEVAAFERQVGSHGGLGGAQTEAFILHPAEWPVDAALLGADALHQQIRRWIARAAEPLTTPR